MGAMVPCDVMLQYVPSSLSKAPHRHTAMLSAYHGTLLEGLGLKLATNAKVSSKSRHD